MPTRLCAAALVAATLSPGPAWAKPGDAAWAQCVQASMPGEAAAWTAMPRPTWQTPFTSASVLLGHKLIAGCSADAANPLKPNREPNWRALGSALKRAKPATAPASAAEVLLCRSSTTKDGRPSLFLYEIVRRAGGAEMTSFRQYMIEHNDNPVKLPQDLRMVPEAGAEVARSCSPIRGDGTLG